MEQDNNPLRDDALLKYMTELRAKDPTAFMDMVLSALKNHPDLAVSDIAPAEHKIRALTRMLKHFEGLENYEDCAFILDLKKKIEDGKDE